MYTNPASSVSMQSNEDPAVDGGTIVPGEFVGCVLLELDDHLMGGPGKAHHERMARLRQRIKFGKWHWLLHDGPSFFGGRHITQLPDWSFKVDMTELSPRTPTRQSQCNGYELFGQERGSNRGRSEGAASGGRVSVLGRAPVSAG